MRRLLWSKFSPQFSAGKHPWVIIVVLWFKLSTLFSHILWVPELHDEMSCCPLEERVYWVYHLEYFFCCMQQNNQKLLKIENTSSFQKKAKKGDSWIKFGTNDIAKSPSLSGFCSAYPQWDDEASIYDLRVAASVPVIKAFWNYISNRREIRQKKSLSSSYSF